jgi:hypothetical protein
MLHREADERGAQNPPSGLPDGRPTLIIRVHVCTKSP